MGEIVPGGILAIHLRRRFLMVKSPPEVVWQIIFVGVDGALLFYFRLHARSPRTQGGMKQVGCITQASNAGYNHSLVRCSKQANCAGQTTALLHTAPSNH